MHFESSEQRLMVLSLWIALLYRVVAGDHDPLGSDQELAALLVSLEGVVVCPLLQVLAPNLLGAHLFDDYSVFATVTIPPDVVTLDEGVWVLCSYRSGLASPGRSVVPLAE